MMPMWASNCQKETRPAACCSQTLITTSTSWTLDPEGNPISRQNLEVKVYKVDWRWWWDNSDDDVASYNSSPDYTVVASGNASTGTNGEGKFSFQVKYPDWGRYLVRVYDPEGGHAAGKIVYIDWPGWAGRAQDENPGGASMLLFAADKDKYEVGENVNLTIPTSGTGRALVSIENGSRVLESHWVEAEDSETHFSFKTTADMAPNVYVNVTLVQPHNQTANDLPIRLYGVIPIKVEDPETHLEPVIDMPDELAPEAPVTIKVRENSGKKMTYTLAVVDEGLLDLTRFKTPDAWSHFYRREALGVTSWDVYDDVIGAFGGKIERLLSLGGDGEGDGGGRKRANRFKPMVKYLGPFELDAGETGSHTFTMPQYIGSVRTMVVAGDNGAYGRAEKATPVRTPLMVMATLPRVVGPGETVKLPVNVFVLDDKVKNVKVEVKTNDGFDVVGSSSQNMSFSAIGDDIIEFDLQTGERTGAAKVQVIATSGSERSEYNLELEIRNPNPPAVDFVDGLANANATWKTDFTPFGITGSNTVTLEVSSIPSVDFGRRLKYLTQYPHGCVEQTTSGAFPQLFLADVMELDSEMKNKIDYNIKGAIERLKGFQKSNGGLSYWPNGETANDWGTSYAGHFLLEAEKKGYSLPGDFKKNWVKYQRKAARDWRKQSARQSDYYKYNDLTQAYRLYTLALANSPELGAMNRLREHADLSVQAKWRLAAAYQLAGRAEVAKKLVDGLTAQVADYKELSNNYGSANRDKAMIIETLSLMNERNRAAPLVKELAGQLSSRRWMSTQTVAYGLVAISRFAGGQAEKGMEFTYAVNGGSATKRTSMKPVMQVELDFKKGSNSLSLDNKGSGVLYCRVIMEGIPPLGEETPAANDMNISVVYKDMNGNPIDVSVMEQGTDFKAEVTVSHAGVRDHYKELALTQIFPSGWEIRNTRLDGTQSVHTIDAPDYMDIRDDRVMQYFNLDRSNSKTFVVLLNSAYQGKYYLPAVSCEAMYDNTINAREIGRWVEVVKPGYEETSMNQ